jgi:Spy/CpxP family protein refolding chaperone
MRCAAQIAILLLMIPTVSLAQSAQDETPNVSTGTARANEDSALTLISTVLSLNDSQQQQLRGDFDAALKTATPIMSQMQDDRLAVFGAVKSGKTEDEIQKLADQQGKLTSRMVMLQAQTFAKLWSILNADQKSQVDDFVYGNIRLVLPASPQ